MNQPEKMNPFLSDKPFNYKKPTYLWRTWMRDRQFVMKKRKYVILDYGFDMKDGVLIDLIIFADCETKKSYTMSEKEFFTKVPIETL